MYKYVIKPIWTYGIEFCGTAAQIKSASEEIERLCSTYKARLENRANALAKNLYVTNFPKRLRRKYPEYFLPAQHTLQLLY